MKKIIYALEALLVFLLFALLRLLPLDWASAFGGFVGRRLGPLLGAHKIAQKNLAMVFPEKSPAERARLVRDMWDNLGRVAAELAFLDHPALFSRLAIEGGEHLPPPGKTALFVSGHLGNWELTYPIAHAYGHAVTLIYRHANNPYVDAVIARKRAVHASYMFRKSEGGAVKIAHAIKKNQSLALLIDQKMNEGIAVPFFGRPAMTAPAIAKLALRHQLPIVPARVVRTEGAHFRGIVYPPLAFTPTGDEEKDTLAIMTQINALLESWIREHPEQWFWVHRRWPKD